MGHASCYELLSGGLTWHEAKVACEARITHPVGSYLFVPSTSEEEKMIRELYNIDVYIGCKAVSTSQFECYHENEDCLNISKCLFTSMEVCNVRVREVWRIEGCLWM